LYESACDDEGFNGTSESKKDAAKQYIRQFIVDRNYYVEGCILADVVDEIYTEMAEYSFLTPYLKSNILRKSTSTLGMILPSTRLAGSRISSKNISAVRSTRLTLCGGYQGYYSFD
jgi:hypothetical protein